MFFLNHADRHVCDVATPGFQSFSDKVGEVFVMCVLSVVARRILRDPREFNMVVMLSVLTVIVAVDILSVLP